MAPKVIRRPAAAKAKAAPRRPEYNIQTIDVVYASKVHKIPPTFLDLTNERIIKLHATWVQVQRFTPIRYVPERTTSYTIFRLTMKVPSNSAARASLGPEVFGKVQKLARTSEAMHHDLVTRYCHLLRYPLF